MSEQSYPQKIVKVVGHPFTADRDGIYSITITARCRSGKQLGERGGEDVRVEIDGIQFREIPLRDKPHYYDIPSAWNGTQLKGLAKTIVLVIRLSKGSHTLVFVPRGSAVIEREPVIERIEDSRRVVFNLNEQAEEGDRRPWHTFAFVDLPLLSIIAEATAQWRFRDSDDVKLIVDNEIQKNTFSLLHRNWAWSGSVLKKFFNREKEEKTFDTNLPKGVHYVEFWADRTPILHRVVLNLGDIDGKRIPTVDDPRWTGDFHDDPEEIILARLILGEAEDQSREAKIWVAASALNRVEAQAWPDTLHEVILQPDQYDPFKINDPNFTKITDPLNRADKLREDAWRESYEIAQALLSGAMENPTSATHFHGRGVSQDWFISHVVPNGKFLKQIDDTHFYWSPN